MWKLQLIWKSMTWKSRYLWLIMCSSQTRPPPSTVILTSYAWQRWIRPAQLRTLQCDARMAAGYERKLARGRPLQKRELLHLRVWFKYSFRQFNLLHLLFSHLQLLLWPVGTRCIFELSRSGSNFANYSSTLGCASRHKGSEELTKLTWRNENKIEHWSTAQWLICCDYIRTKLNLSSPAWLSFTAIWKTSNNISTHQEMDNTYREAADPPEECSPKKVIKEMSVGVKKTAVGVFFGWIPTRMNILLTSPAVLVLLSSSFATSVNSLVKKMSSGMTGIYTIQTH